MAKEDREVQDCIPLKVSQWIPPPLGIQLSDSEVGRSGKVLEVIRVNGLTDEQKTLR